MHRKEPAQSRLFLFVGRRKKRVPPTAAEPWLIFLPVKRSPIHQGSPAPLPDGQSVREMQNN